MLIVTVSVPSEIVTTSLVAACEVVVTVTVLLEILALILAVLVEAVYVPLPPVTVAVAL